MDGDQHRPHDTNASSLAIDPANSKILYAGLRGNDNKGTGGGVFKTTDGGASWTAINTGLASTRVQALAVDPANSSTVYAAAMDAIVPVTYAGVGGGVYKTTDGGASWTAINTGLKSYIATDVVPHRRPGK